MGLSRPCPPSRYWLPIQFGKHVCQITRLRPVHRTPETLSRYGTQGTSELIVFVERMFQYSIRRTIIPTWIVIAIQFDRHNYTTPDVRALPPASFGVEDLAYQKFGMSHPKRVRRPVRRATI